MATIKLTSSTLGNLINLINQAAAQTATLTTNPFANTFPSNSFGPGNNFGATPNVGAIGIDDDSIPANMLEAAPVFEMNYKSTRKQCIKKAKDLLTIIVKEVVPTMLLNSNMIITKIDADAEQLGNLYYAWEQSDKIIQACMETIARGETQARLFDTYAKLQDGQLKLAVKITETQNQMRKYYIDTYLDLQQKDEADDNALSIAEGKNTKAIENKVEEVDDTNNAEESQTNILVGTDQTIKMIAERKRKAMMAKYEEVK